MADRSRRRLFPNPFYVVVLVASTFFTLTVLAYLISPSIAQKAREHPAAGGPGPGSVAMAAWLDRSGPWVIAIELSVMLASSFLAMATDRWFPVKPPRQPPSSG